MILEKWTWHQIARFHVKLDPELRFLKEKKKKKERLERKPGVNWRLTCSYSPIPVQVNMQLS
jgi:hypothetical protein